MTVASLLAASAGLLCGAASAVATPGTQREDAYRLTRSTLPLDIAGGRLGLWSPLRATSGATITFEKGARQNLLRLADPPGSAGYVTISASLSPQKIIRADAKIALVSQFLRRGKVRPLVSVAGADGTAYQAGVFRNYAGRLVWAAWVKTPSGETVDLVNGGVARTAVWHTLALTTRWGVRNSRAVLTVDGAVAARTVQRDLSAVAAERVFIGLGRVSKKTETGVMLVRSAGATGAAPTAVGGAAGGGAGGVGGLSPAPPPAATETLPGREVERADFETGNLSQWGGVQRVAADRIQVVKSPTRQGGYAGRFEVRNGDNPVDSNDRAEVSLPTGETEGDENWYAWSAMFDPSFPTLSGFQLITQWHTSLGGSPAMGVYIEGNDLLVQVNRFDGGGGLLSVDKIWRGPLPRGRWLDLKFHIKWSSSDSTGWIEFWADGVRQTFDDGTQRRFIRNLKPGGSNYLKQGYYRQAGQGPTGIVYIDGFRMSTVG